MAGTVADIQFTMVEAKDDFSFVQVEYRVLKGHTMGPCSLSRTGNQAVCSIGVQVVKLINHGCH